MSLDVIADRGVGKPERGGIEVSGWRQIGLAAGARDEYEFLDEMIRHGMMRVTPVPDEQGIKIADGANIDAARYWGLIHATAKKLASRSALKRGAVKQTPESWVAIAKQLYRETLRDCPVNAFQTFDEVKSYLDAKLKKAK